MILYFADRKMNVLGQASTKLPDGLIITEDNKTEDIETGVAVFQCKIHFDETTRDKIDQWTEVGNYILRNQDQENEFYTIIETETDTKEQTVYLYAEDAGMDLLNEVFGAYEADKAYPISHYINKYAAGSGFEIGINEAESLTRKLKWDGEATATERIASVAAQFDGCEVSYNFSINGLLVTNKYINIYKQRGKDLGIQLRLNEDIDRIVTTKSIANLATALQCTGGTPENTETPVTLKGYQYDDGDFYVDGTLLKSKKAFERWSRYLSKELETEKPEVGGHIVKQYSYDTTSQATLCANAVTELKKIRDMDVNYEVDITKLPDNVKIGDRVNIIDDAGNLYLSTRILALERSECNQTQTATLGEYLIRNSGISARVEDLAKQFAEVAKNRVFYTWTAYADDEQGSGISTEPVGKAYLGMAVNKTEQLPDLSDPTVYTWSKIKGEDGLPGEKGDPKYVWIKYADSPTTGMSDSAIGKDYMGIAHDKNTPVESTDYADYTWSRIKGQDGTGIQSITAEYYLSTSKTAQTGGSWLASPPQWVSEKYLWIRTVITYTDNSIARTEPVCDSSWEAAGNVEDKINSRGQQLVTNGNGALGNNINFSGWTFDGATANNSPGSFLRGAIGTVFSDEFFPIDVNLKYRLDFDAKTKSGLSTLYSMIAFYDVDKNPITAVHNMYFPDTLTELTQDLENGDTVVHVKSLANWNTDGTATYQRKFVFWNYTNSFGYTHPPLTYSRNLSVTDAFADENVNVAAGTIILRTPWSGGLVKTGTKLSQSNSGNGYKYIGVVGSIVPKEWTHYSGKIAGVDYSGLNKGGMFPPGTAYGKAGFLWNYNNAADTTWITNVSVCEDVKTDIESMKQTFADYKTEINLNLDSISSAVTETQTTITTTTENIYDELGNLRDTTITEEQLTEVKNSLVEQYSDLIEMRFTSVKDLVDALGGTVDDNQRLLEQYIRFEGAMIELGRSDSALIARLSNNKLAFLENGQEVAYISNLKMYITDAQINRTLSFGDHDTGYYTWTIGESGTYDLEYMEG